MNTILVKFNVKKVPPILLPVPGSHFPSDIALDRFSLVLQEPEQRLVLTCWSVLVKARVRPLGVVELLRDVSVILTHRSRDLLSSLLPSRLLLGDVQLKYFNSSLPPFLPLWCGNQCHCDISDSQRSSPADCSLARNLSEVGLCLEWDDGEKSSLYPW